MSATEPAADSDGPSTLVNALVGGIVAVVLAFLPFSPALGGALAGYLQGPETGQGLRVGAFAGLVSTVPFALLTFLVGGALLAFVPFGMGMMDPTVGAFGIVGAFVLVGVVLLGLLYTVGLAALGGVLGAYLNRELD